MDENIENLIQSYEQINSELKKDLEYIKIQPDNLKIQTSSVLNENQELRKNYNELLKNTLQPTDNVEKDEIIENLRKQLEKVSDEKNYATKLWQNSVETIDKLEEELRIYQSGLEEFVPRKQLNTIKQTCEEKIKTLQEKLYTAETKLKENFNVSIKEIKSKYTEVDKSFEIQENSFKIIKNLEQEILSLQQRLQQSVTEKNELELYVKDKGHFYEMITKRNVECRQKVTESVQVVEAALMEKDAALIREKNITDKMKSLENQLVEISKLAEEKSNHEIYVVKNEYNEKMQQILINLNSTQEEIKSKNNEIEKMSAKCILLEDQLERFKKGNINFDESSTSKLLILEKNLENTFQKLLLSEKQNVQLIAQRDCIKNDMEEMSRHYARDVKSREVEKLTLQNKIKQFQKRLDDSNSEYCRVTERMEKLNEKILIMEQDFNSNIESKETVLKNLHSTELLKINEYYNQAVKDLENEVEIQKEINKKWRIETKAITSNLEKLINDLKKAIHALKKENKTLKLKLEECDNTIKDYKTFIDLISSDVTKITQLTKP